jgi:hypothetical protein
MSKRGGCMCMQLPKRGRVNPGPNLGGPPTQLVMGPCPPRLLTSWLARSGQGGIFEPQLYSSSIGPRVGLVWPRLGRSRAGSCLQQPPRSSLPGFPPDQSFRRPIVGSGKENFEIPSKGKNSIAWGMKAA